MLPPHHLPLVSLTIDHQYNPKNEYSYLSRLPLPPAPSISSSLTSPTSRAFLLLPQLLFSSTIPGSENKQKDRPSVSNNRNGGSKAPLVLTTRDPLSLQMTSANFKRSVARVGPIFWLQERIEEVVVWCGGWRVTLAYRFFCKRSSRP